MHFADTGKKTKVAVCIVNIPGKRTVVKSVSEFCSCFVFKLIASLLVLFMLCSRKEVGEGKGRKGGRGGRGCGTGGKESGKVLPAKIQTNTRR